MKLLILIGSLLIISAFGEEQGFDFEVDGQKFSLTPEKISQTIEKTKESLTFLEGDEETIKKVSYLSLVHEPGVNFMRDLSAIFEKSALDLVEKVNPPNKHKITYEVSELSLKWKRLFTLFGMDLNSYKVVLRKTEKVYKESPPSEKEETKEDFQGTVKDFSVDWLNDSIGSLKRLKNVILDQAVKMIEELYPGAGSLEGEKVARKIIDYYLSVLKNLNN